MGEFSILGFVAKLTEMTITTHEFTEQALKESARIVQKEAKDSIGDYQGDAGPFMAWSELADSTKEDRIRLGFTENDPGERSGEMRESIETTVHADGMTGEAHIGSDADEMVWFELGTTTQPPRSVLGGALFRKADEVEALIGSSVMAGLTGASVFNGYIPVIK